MWTPATRQSGAWDNLYLHQNSTIADSNITLNMLPLYRTSQDLTNCNCWEFEIDKQLSGLWYDGGWQARFDDGHWWYFNPSLGTNGEWVPSGIPIRIGDFVPGQFTHISAQYQVVTGGLKFLTLAVQGQCNQVGWTSPTRQRGGADHLNWAFQLDSRGKGAPINIALAAYNVFTF